MSVMTGPESNGTNGCRYSVTVTREMPDSSVSSVQKGGAIQDRSLEVVLRNESLSCAFWTNGPENNDFLTGYEFPNQEADLKFDGLNDYAAEIEKLHFLTLSDPALFVGEMEKRILRYSVLPSDLRDALSQIYENILNREISLIDEPRKVLSSLLKKGLLTDDMIQVLNNDSRFGKSNETFKNNNYFRDKDNF